MVENKVFKVLWDFWWLVARRSDAIFVENWKLWQTILNMCGSWQAFILPILFISIFFFYYFIILFFFYFFVRWGCNYFLLLTDLFIHYYTLRINFVKLSSIKTYIYIQKRKIYIKIFVEKPAREAKMIEIAIAWSARLKDKELEKINKCQFLWEELGKLYKLKKVTVVPILIGALVAVFDMFEKYTGKR